MVTAACYALYIWFGIYMFIESVFENILKIYYDINRSAGAHNAGSIPAAPSYGRRHE